MNTVLATTLQKMINTDQKAVRRRQQKGVVNARVLKLNTQKMKKLVARYGWPTASLVGKEGSKNAWLIVQHADDLRFQKKCLELMQKAFRKNKSDVAPMQIAFLTDRILVNEKGLKNLAHSFIRIRKVSLLIGLFGICEM